jgi:hypothetical protein
LFPEDPNTPFYCSVGANLNGEYIRATTKARVINSTLVECPDINKFCTDVDFNITQASLFLAYNTQDFTTASTLYFYPAIRIERLGQYTYTPYQSELQVKLIGKNFINTAKDL